MSTTAVMRAVGQPYTRLGREFGFCAEDAAGRRTMMTATFSAKGRLTRLT
jgi:hypothetical protein